LAMWTEAARQSLVASLANGVAKDEAAVRRLIPLTQVCLDVVCLSDPIGTVARADTDGEGAVALGISEVVSRRRELRGFFDQATLAGWFCVSWLWKVPRGWAEKPTSFA
jgi:hypothetical protein